MAEAVPDCDDQSLQRFLTNSPWEDQRVVEQITHDANSLLGGHVGSCLIIDESGMPKKGKNSVNVSKQWCGQLGKTDNYQVGVYSSLCRCEYAVPIGYRLFLPQCWITQKAGIPDEFIEFQSKPGHAAQLVIEARGKRADLE